jgi:hypothetical protein
MHSSPSHLNHVSCRTLVVHMSLFVFKYHYMVSKGVTSTDENDRCLRNYAFKLRIPLDLEASWNIKPERSALADFPHKYTETTGRTKHQLLQKQHNAYREKAHHAPESRSCSPLNIVETI